MFTTPVIIIIYNRPKHLHKVLTSVAQLKPKKLLIIGDGPHPDRPEDINKILEARKLIENLPWDCEIITNYSSTNLGLRRRVVSGLEWAFEQVDMAIILEDDCVPDPSFFYFSQQLLEKYLYDDRLMVISGNNFQKGRNRTEYSYYFSRYNHCWGWSTWRRSWMLYDDDMKLWPEIRDGDWLFDILDNDKYAVNYWKTIFQDVFQNKIDSWAYRWTFSCWIQGGLTALPHTNLVTNIGFGKDSTHTTTKKQTRNLLSNELIFPIKHPPYMIRDTSADRYTQNFHFGSGFEKRLKRSVAHLLIRLGLFNPK